MEFLVCMKEIEQYMSKDFPSQNKTKKAIKRINVYNIFSHKVSLRSYTCVFLSFLLGRPVLFSMLSSALL